MKRMIVCALVAVLFGCDRDRNKREELARSEAYSRELRTDNPGMTNACLEKLRSGAIGITGYIDNPDCFEMMPAQRWTGLWNTGWEWTNFCPDAKKECDGDPERGGVWLTFAKGAYRGPSNLPDGVYQIDFVGRRSKAPGYFGHQGGYDHFMVVDQVLSIQTVPGEKYTKRF